jgi:large subunit ribosomal protein L3
MSVTSLLGRKIGMTSIFEESGSMIGVTVLEVGPNRVLSRRTTDRDGYDAVALAWGERRASRQRKPQLGQATAVGIETDPQFVREVRVPADAEVAAGDTISLADVFEVGQYVDVTGTSRGHGFQGTRKRHNFSYGPASHGSKNYREPGSTGHCTTPGRVFKGKKMAGQHGAKKRTMRNLRVVRLDSEKNLLFVAGPVPGHDEANLMVRHAVAKYRPKS